MGSLTLEQMSYVSQIIGVIVIIASLIYVGIEIRQNTEQMEINIATVFAQWADSVYSRAAIDREFAEVWNRGNSDFGSMDDVDKQRILHYEMGAITMWSHFFHLYKTNKMPKYFWEAQLWAYKNVGGRQAIREAWKAYKGSFDKPFQDFMAQYLE